MTVGRIIVAVGVCVILLSLSACDNGTDPSLWDQIKQLGQEKTDLKLQAEQLQEENEELKQRIQTLSTLADEAGIEAVAQLERIELTKRTGLYDKDEDGRKETLIYFCPPIS